MHAGVDHFSEPLLKNNRVGRRSIGDESFVARAILDRADQADRLIARVEDRLDHLCRRRLAGGSGDADERGFVRGMSVEVRRDDGERGARIVRDDQWSAAALGGVARR